MTVSPAATTTDLSTLFAIQVLNAITIVDGAVRARVSCADGRHKDLAPPEIKAVLSRMSSLDPTLRMALTESLIAVVLKLLEPPASRWDRLRTCYVEILSVSLDLSQKISSSSIRFSAQALNGAAGLASRAMKCRNYIFSGCTFLMTAAAAAVRSGLYKLPEDATAYRFLDSAMDGAHKIVTGAVGPVETMCQWATESVGEHSQLATTALVSSLASVVYLLYINHKMPEVQPVQTALNPTTA